MDESNLADPDWGITPEALAVQFHLEHIISTITLMDNPEEIAIYVRDVWRASDDKTRYELFGFAIVQLREDRYEED